MRRTLVAVITSAALIFGGIPTVQAQSSIPSVEGSIEDLPSELKIGSSGMELLSSDAKNDQTEGGKRLLQDWLIGFVAVTVVGTVINFVMSAMR